MNVKKPTREQWFLFLDLLDRLEKAGHSIGEHKEVLDYLLDQLSYKHSNKPIEQRPDYVAWFARLTCEGLRRLGYMSPEVSSIEIWAMESGLSENAIKYEFDKLRQTDSTGLAFDDDRIVRLANKYGILKKPT